MAGHAPGTFTAGAEVAARHSPIGYKTAGRKRSDGCHTIVQSSMHPPAPSQKKIAKDTDEIKSCDGTPFRC